MGQVLPFSLLSQQMQHSKSFKSCKKRIIFIIHSHILTSPLYPSKSSLPVVPIVIFSSCFMVLSVCFYTFTARLKLLLIKKYKKMREHSEWDLCQVGVTDGDISTAKPPQLLDAINKGLYNIFYFLYRRMQSF